MRNSLQCASSAQPTFGVVIRFKNSAATLPGVLEALRRQTVQPDIIVGVNNQSADGSVAMMRTAGAKIIDWNEPYSHPRVLNHGIRNCPTDLVLVLSSHTVLRSADAIARLLGALEDPRTACVSGRWDDDPFYSDAISWQELLAKGLKFGSIYSNSFGMLRRERWEEMPFDEALPTMEDYAWALEQVRHGHVCRRVNFEFSYQRGGRSRYFLFAAVTFRLAARYSLPVAWLGPRGTARELVLSAATRSRNGEQGTTIESRSRVHRQRLWAWLTWRLKMNLSE